MEPSFSRSGSAPGFLGRRAPEAGPKEVEPAFAVVEPPQRLAPRQSKARKESKCHPFF